MAISKGGMATVYLASAPALDEPVALKVLHSRNLQGTKDSDQTVDTRYTASVDMILGTPVDMCREQAQGNPTNGQTDVYSLDAMPYYDCSV